MKIRYFVALGIGLLGCGSPHWSNWEENGTVHIFIDSNDFSDQDLEIIYFAVRSWDKALDGYLNFEYVQSKGYDNLIVIRSEYEEKINEEYDRDAITMTVPWEDGGGIILPLDASRKQLKINSLHELGHALGLHHTGPGTIMAPNAADDSKVITCADVKQFCEVNDCNRDPNSFQICSENSI